MSLNLILNGQERSFDALEPGAMLDSVVDALGLKADRVAVERNGDIVPRSLWPQTSVASGDKLEVVHFVGGGSIPSSDEDASQR